MQEKKKGNIASRVSELVRETVEECGCTLWNVEFVKEGGEHNLIIYIDKPEGISLDDCEMVNDAVDPILDEADLIDGSYYLEISSPGLERELKKPEHIEAFVGERVMVKLYALKDGKKALDGIIASYDRENGVLVLKTEACDYSLEMKECASIKTVCEF